MAHATQNDVSTSEEATLDAQKSLYKGVMDFTMTVGLPVGGAIALFVALLLMNAGIPMSLLAAFATWIGLLWFSKAFLVH